MIEKKQLGDPNNVLTTDYVYDKFRNMIEQRQIPDPDEPETYLATTFEYDCRGLMTQKTLPKGAITTLAYNAWGLKTEQIADFDGIDQKTEYGYNRLGRQTSITGYADGSTAQTTTYDLDNLGRVETITYPDANSIAYEYYPQGTVKKRTDQRKLATYYEYDHVGNLVKKTVSFDGSDYEETFTYDGLRRMTLAAKYRDTTTHIATSDFEYNAFGKVTEATETILDADAVEIGYEYDQLGNLTGITYPDADDVTISREALGRIDTIKLDGDTIASYKYIGGRVKRRSYNSPSVTYDINYNGLGQATRHYTYKSGADITDFGYEYDDNGNITKQEFNHRPSTPYNDYDYDDLDRLTEADYLVGVLTEDEQFTYDDLGNRTSVNLRSGDNESYSVNNLTNRYNTVGGNSLDYDDAGNLTQDPNGYEYEYDYENRLIEITKGQTTIAQYEYDALGRRIQRIDSVANETTRYYYDNQWRVLAEFDDNNTQLRDYIYGNFIDEVLVMIDSNEDEYYYAHNRIYSSVALIDENGNIVERYEYNAYGAPTIYNSDFSQTYDASQYGNPYMLTGRHMDSIDGDALKLGYNRTRYLDYYTGRWLSHDTLGIMQKTPTNNEFKPIIQHQDGLNLYEYVKSNPIILLDTIGLWSEDIHFWQTYEWTSKDHGMYWEYAYYVAEADLGVDPETWKWPFHAMSRNILSWHFNIPHEKELGWDSLDSRFCHAFNQRHRALQICSKCNASKSEIINAVNELGKGLHTLQDWVAHGTWDPTRVIFNWGIHPDGTDDKSLDYRYSDDKILRDFSDYKPGPKPYFIPGNDRYLLTEKRTIDYLNKFKSKLNRNCQCYCKLYKK